MKIAKKVLSLVNEQTEKTEVVMHDFKETNKQPPRWPSFIKTPAPYPELAEFGDVEIYKGYWSQEATSPYVANAFIMFYKGDVVAESSEFTNNQKIFKEINKAFQTIVKKHNLKFSMDNGKPIKVEAEAWKQYLDDKNLQRTERAINILKSGIEAKMIWNVDFEDAKYTINNLYDRVFQNLKNDAEKKSEITGPARAWFQSQLYMGGLSLVKTLAKISHDSNEGLVYIKKVMIQIGEVMALVQEAKPFTQKGRKPVDNPNSKPKFVPKATSMDSKKEIIAIYEGMLDDWVPKQTKIVIEQYLSDIENFKELLTKSSTDKKIASVFLLHPGRRFFNDGKLINDHKKVIETEAKKLVESVRDKFIHKNVNKIVSIVVAKGNLKEYKIVNNTSNRGRLEGVVLFTFEDGSSFVVNTQVVVVFEARQPFIRVPTTFKNIKMANGTSYKMKSEEWMNTEFVKPI